MNDPKPFWKKPIGITLIILAAILIIGVINAITGDGTDQAETETTPPTEATATSNEAWREGYEDITDEIKALFLESGDFVEEAYMFDSETAEGERHLHVRTDLIWDWDNPDEENSATHTTALAMCEAAANEYGDVRVVIQDHEANPQVIRAIGEACK